MSQSSNLETPQVRQSILAGLETGIVGGLCVLLYYALGSALSGDVLWATPLRLGEAVFGRSVYRDGAAAAVCAGLSVQFVTTGLLGAIFGMVTRRTWALRRVFLLGPVLALGWYYLGYEVLLRRFAAGPSILAPRRSLLVAHFLLGLVLAMYPRFLHALRRSSGEPY